MVYINVHSMYQLYSEAGPVILQFSLSECINIFNYALLGYINIIFPVCPNPQPPALPLSAQ